MLILRYIVLFKEKKSQQQIYKINLVFIYLVTVGYYTKIIKDILLVAYQRFFFDWSKWLRALKFIQILVPKFLAYLFGPKTPKEFAWIRGFNSKIKFWNYCYFCTIAVQLKIAVISYCFIVLKAAIFRKFLIRLTVYRIFYCLRTIFVVELPNLIVLLLLEIRKINYQLL